MQDKKWIINFKIFTEVKKASRVYRGQEPEFFDKTQWIASDEKIKYLTALFIGSVKEQNPDLFEEQLNKLNSLSIREINFLISFYKYQLDHIDEDGWFKQNIWREFVEKQKKRVM